MKTFAFNSRVLYAAGSLLVGSSSGLFAADLVLQKVPPLTVAQTAAYPENLARHHLGAQLQTLSAGAPTVSDDKASALVSGDPAATYALPSGTNTLLVSLPQIENVGSISFLNEGAQGNVTVATSNAKLPADSPQWHNALQQELSAAGIDAKVGPSEAKYVRLTFNITQPGKIAGFGVYSTPQVSDFTRTRSSKPSADDKTGSFGLIAYNQTDIHAKARALYVSSGADVKQANNMIDDQPTTTYRFAAEDGSPTTVIDLGERRTLRRLSAVYAPRAGSMQFYVLQNLPAEAPVAGGMPGTVRIDDATLASMPAIGAATDDGSQGRASIDFPETAGRYVMVRWMPAAQQDSGFTLAEVAAIGGTNGTLLAQNAATAGLDEDSTETQTSDGKTMLDGKTMIDAKDMPGEGPAEPPAEGPSGPPPSLPQPPPFNFIPVSVPQIPPLSP